MVDWFEEQAETPGEAHQAINQVLMEHMRRVRFPGRKEAGEATGQEPAPMQGTEASKVVDNARMAETERQIARIVKADLYQRFPAGFVFDPIRVYSRTDHMGDGYLNVFII